MNTYGEEAAKAHGVLVQRAFCFLALSVLDLSRYPWSCLGKEAREGTLEHQIKEMLVRWISKKPCGLTQILQQTSGLLGWPTNYAKPILWPAERRMSMGQQLPHLEEPGVLQTTETGQPLWTASICCELAPWLSIKGLGRVARGQTDPFAELLAWHPQPPNNASATALLFLVLPMCKRSVEVWHLQVLQCV